MAAAHAGSAAAQTRWNPEDEDWDPTPYAQADRRGLGRRLIFDIEGNNLLPGLAGFVSIHDAYGTHAADMWPLFHILREAFVLVHSENMLVEFRASCAKVVVAEILASQPELTFEQASEMAANRLPDLPAMGRFQLADVLSSDYSFS